MKSATQIVWEAAGAPAPCATDGTPIPRTRGAAGRCSLCDSPDAGYSRSLLTSSNFVPTKNANRLDAYGGDRACAACVFASKTLRLRCISWFASAEGVRFWRTRPAEKGAPRPDALATLLDPPEPPFVVGIPLYGIAHGGEAHWRRTWWPGEPVPTDVLVRLQSKHVALYARPAFSRDRYPVQIDDALEFLLDRETWLFAREVATEAMVELVDAGLKPYPAKLSLRTLTIQGRVPAGVSRNWRSITEPLSKFTGTVWWPLFCDLIPEIQ
jgi:hypothetical protein